MRAAVSRVVDARKSSSMTVPVRQIFICFESISYSSLLTFFILSSGGRSAWQRFAFSYFYAAVRPSPARS
jgi:hypothetical protein